MSRERTAALTSFTALVPTVVSCNLVQETMVRGSQCHVYVGIAIYGGIRKRALYNYLKPSSWLTKITGTLGIPSLSWRRFLTGFDAAAIEAPHKLFAGGFWLQPSKGGHPAVPEERTGRTQACPNGSLAGLIIGNMTWISVDIRFVMRFTIHMLK